MKTNNGFTLIELMVAVAIAAILLAVAVPSFNAMLAGNRLATQTNDVIGAVLFARSEAIRRNRTITFCRAASATANTCTAGVNWTDWIVTNNPAAGTATDTLRRGSFAQSGEAMRISSTLAASRLAFRPDGLTNVTGGADTISLCTTSTTTNNVRQIEIGLSGRTTTQTLTGACP